MKFGGILKTVSRSWNEHGLETFCTDKTRVYTPFKNETADQIERIKKMFPPVNNFTPHAAPAWNESDVESLTIGKALDVTSKDAQNFEALQSGKVSIADLSQRALARVRKIAQIMKPEKGDIGEVITKEIIA